MQLNACALTIASMENVAVISQRRSGCQIGGRFIDIGDVGAIHWSSRDTAIADK